MAHPRRQHRLVDEVLEQLLPVELDDRDPFEIRRVQGIVGFDVDLDELERLALALVDADGTLRRRLTPPGGARDLLPAEYAYTLPAKALARLGAGTYRFRATARAPRSQQATTGRSASFTERP